jgi:hypothetical protein
MKKTVKKLDPKKFRIIKFLNGEQIICTLIRATKEVLKVSSPMKLVIIPIMTKNEEPASHIILNRYVPLSDDLEYDIYKTSVISVSGANKQIGEYYTDGLMVEEKHLRERNRKPKYKDSMLKVKPAAKAAADEPLDVEFTPDEDAVYTESEFEDGVVGEVKKKDVHPLLRKKMTNALKN